MPFPVMVTISRDDIVAAEGFVATLRSFKRCHGIKSGARVEGAESVEWDIGGRLAEIAVGKFLGLETNDAIQAKGDGGWDFNLGTMSKPILLDVKSVSVQKQITREYYLTAGEHGFDCHLACLALVSPQRDYVAIAGFTTRALFAARAERVVNWKARKNDEPLALHQSSLMPAWGMLKYRGML